MAHGQDGAELYAAAQEKIEGLSALAEASRDIGGALELNTVLPRMAERGDVKSGSQALLLGFGAGMCYAAQVITVP